MHSFEEKLAKSWPADRWRDVSTLVAVSGGADSVGLLRGLTRLKTGGRGQLLVGHFHHGLRPQADAEERFVRQLCDQLRLPCHVGYGQVGQLADQQGDGLEAAARHSRYAFLQAVAEQQAARYLVTAHTADDQVETILHRILRGTGLAGLAGIRRVRQLSPAVSLLRPLLDFRRSEVLAYLSQLQQDYCHDESNLDTRLTRNRIRHQLLPLLADQFHPAVDQALLRLGTLAGEAQAVIDELVDEHYERSVRVQAPNRVVIQTARLPSTRPYIIRELCIRIWQQQEWPQQDMGRAQWEQLAHFLLQPDGGKTVLPGSITAEKKDEQLVLTRP
ncbi:MAG: tRNA lysidine(34) synthetase TilS [Planctomycetales bacterium]|nr:tRNA lysidine(34) synthetase TilS [Planctomycetales bacterium]NIP69717.1 tRNA lysidine(34) synthetase TilS [Planctomycetales bacterium]